MLTFFSYLIGFCFFVAVVSVVIGVPFMPTHKKQTELMMDYAGVNANTIMVDLGSGAGRLMFAAARRGAKKITGYELNPFLYLWTNLMILLKGYRGRVFVKCRSLYDADLSEANLVTAFLFPPLMARVEKKLLAECKPGTTLAMYTFALPNLAPKFKKEAISIYTVPGK